MAGVIKNTPNEQSKMKTMSTGTRVDAWDSKSTALELRLEAEPGTRAIARISECQNFSILVSNYIL